MTEQTIRQDGMVGQKAAIRLVNPYDAEELDRLRRIDTDPERIKWFESEPDNYKPLTDEELAEQAGNTSDHYMFAVSGSADNEKLDDGEAGKLQGWVQVDADNPERISQIQTGGLVRDMDVDLSRVFEITYSRLPDARHKQMASALRQVLAHLAGVWSTDESEDRPRVTVTAYIINDERGTNTASVKVLENAGFVEVGSVKYDDEASQNDRLFVLDWDKLETELKRDADPYWEEKEQRVA